MKQQKAGLPNTYVVQDLSDGKEVQRLAIQDSMLTHAMGGVLPEQENPGIFSRVLDIACGPGGWLLELATEYPLVQAEGIDVNAKNIEYANAHAEQRGLANRVKYQVMDATLMLRFPPATFDLVNLRLGQSFLRIWDWPKMISEMLRVSRIGGTIRVVDGSVVPTSDSAALTEVFMTIVRAFRASGRLHEETPTGIAFQLAPLLHQHGVKEVQSKVFDVIFRQGTEAGEAHYQDIANLIQTIRPFLQKFANASKDFDAVGQQALLDIQQPGFESKGIMVVAWGKKASETTSTRFRDGE